jgi:F-type H+-transporting ATPase subunit b
VELTWSTFLLEIINFLVLIWILKRFLFHPVRAVIARRRAAIEKRMQDAEALQVEALTLKQQYQDRLTDWEMEKQQLRRTLAEELESERVDRLSEITQQIESERERDRVTKQRQQEDLLHSMEETAIRQGAAFATRLLQVAAGAETEARLIEQVIEALDRLPQSRIESFQAAQREKADLHIVTAYPLGESQQRRLQAALTRLIASHRPPNFERDETLLAGIRIATGNWLLGCNLKDELAGFTEFDHDE